MNPSVTDGSYVCLLRLVQFSQLREDPCFIEGKNRQALPRDAVLPCVMLDQGVRIRLVDVCLDLDGGKLRLATRGAAQLFLGLLVAGCLRIAANDLDPIQQLGIPHEQQESERVRTVSFQVRLGFKKTRLIGMSWHENPIILRLRLRFTCKRHSGPVVPESSEYRHGHTPDL